MLSVVSIVCCGIAVHIHLHKRYVLTCNSSYQLSEYRLSYTASRSKYHLLKRIILCSGIFTCYKGAGLCNQCVITLTGNLKCQLVNNFKCQHTSSLFDCYSIKFTKTCQIFVYSVSYCIKLPCTVVQIYLAHHHGIDIVIIFLHQKRRRLRIV